MDNHFSGKTILITGAASGIGAASAQRLAAKGAKIIAMDLNAPSFEVVQYIPVDMADPAAIDKAVALLPSSLDGLCNIAGVPGNAGVDKTMRINFLGLRHLTESVLPRFTRGSAIVNLASVAGNGWPERLASHLALARSSGFAGGLQWLGEHPVSSETVYQFSKEALIVWTMAMGSQWYRKHGVRMNCVSPGPVDTALLKDFRETLGQEKVAKAIDQMGRAGLPSDIAPVVEFFCSPDSSWIVGQSLSVDAGLSAARTTGST